LAVHLPEDDPKIRQILARLVAVLSTPSEAVQRSVSDCLPPLMKALDEEERRALIEAGVLLSKHSTGVESPPPPSPPPPYTPRI
jgi:hypothetical protein